MNVISSDVLFDRLCPHKAALVRMYQTNARNLDGYARRQQEQGATETALKCIREADKCREIVEAILLDATRTASIPFRGKVS